MTLKKVRSFKSKDLLNKKQCWHKNGLKNLQDNSLNKYKDHHKPTEDDGLCDRFNASLNMLKKLTFL